MSNVIKLENQRKTKKKVKPMESVEKEDLETLDLEMVKRGIVGGLGMLDKAIETSDLAPDRAAMASAIQKTLKNMSSLVSLIEHDMVGAIKGLENQAIGQWTTYAHMKVLIETLKEKEIVTDSELESTWNKIIPPMMEEMQSQS